MELQYKDKTKSLEERKALYQTEVMDKRMNPIDPKDFDPATFDPMKEDTPEYEAASRPRVEPPAVLPTNGMKPKKMLEGQMLGMFESKQDLYLIFAHKCNQLQAEIDLLKSKIK